MSQMRTVEQLTSKRTTPGVNRDPCTRAPRRKIRNDRISGRTTRASPHPSSFVSGTCTNPDGTRRQFERRLRLDPTGTGYPRRRSQDRPPVDAAASQPAEVRLTILPPRFAFRSLRERRVAPGADAPRVDARPAQRGTARVAVDAGSMMRLAHR